MAALLDGWLTLTNSRRCKDIGAVRCCRARRLSTALHTTRRSPAFLRRLVAARVHVCCSVPSAHPPSTYSLLPSRVRRVCLLFYGNRPNSSRRTGTEGFPLLPLRTCTLRSRGSRTRSTSEQTRANTRTFTPTWVNRFVRCPPPPLPQPLGLYLRVLVGACCANSRIVFISLVWHAFFQARSNHGCKTLIHSRCICHRVRVGVVCRVQ